MPESIVFVDSRVGNPASLLSQFPADILVVSIEPELDGFKQIVKALQGLSGLDSISIISYGSPGNVEIGNAVIDNAALEAAAAELALIGSALREDGDILLYGCKVGEGDEGKDFIATLSSLTGADVAASDDRSGGSVSGGDRELEAHSGRVGHNREQLSVDYAEVLYSEPGTEFRINTYTESTQAHQSVTSLTGGGFVVTWESSGQDGSGRGVYGQRYDASGNAAGSEFQVNTYTGNNQQSPSVTSLSDGGFVVTWESSSQDGSGHGIYGQRYDSLGSTVGDEFRINTYTGSNQQSPSVTSLSDGGFVVTWESSGQDGSGHGVYGQRYDASGNAAGSEFRINTYTGNNQQSPSVTSLSDGGFVVTWESSGQDGSGHGVYGQRYDSLGNTVGDEFRINTFTDNNQKSPSVTSLSDGGFVVTWESSGQDGSGHGIYGQRYDSLGNTVGDEFRINTFTDNNQKSPSVTSLSDGGFVVTWESFGQDGFGLGIFGKYHDTNLNTLGNYNENSAPTLTGFDGTVQMTEEDAEVEISFADLIRAGDEADVNGTVNGFVIKSVESGTLRIGTDAASASAYDAAANNRIDAAQHAYWTPDADANGELGAFSVVAVDDSGAESAIPVEARVRVTAVNDAPEGIVTISGALEQGETLTADASGISDPDGLGVFSYQWYADGEAIEGATLESYELTGLEVGKQMTVRMSYTDGQGTEEAVTSASTGEVSNTNNTPPVIEQPIPDGAAYTEEIYTYDVSAHFRDDDAGDTLHYSATNVDGSVLPAWLTIDPVSGILSGIAQSGDIGINGVLVRATDASGSTVEDMFRLLVTNRNYGETEGNDRLFGGSGDDAIFGSGGDDRIFGRAGEDILVGGTGDDFLRGDDGNDELYGGNGTDRLYGGSGNDLLYGDEGNDTLFGQNGRDTLYGGNGDDTMRGGGGDDLFYGGEGDDTLFGQGGRDTLYGGNGDDSIRGDNGNDELYGGNGADSLSGGGGNDLLYGGEGNDVLSGQGGGDTLYGGNGDDSLRGGSGNDLLYGGEGNDALFGQGGRDTLYGGNGTDRLSGGGGNDTLLYTDILESGTGPNERDVITDFTPGRDKIDLSAIDANSDLSGDQAFSTTLIDGGDPFSDAGQLRFDIDSGILYGNVDSDLAADFAIQVEISGVGALSFLDIIF